MESVSFDTASRKSSERSDPPPSRLTSADDVATIARHPVQVRASESGGLTADLGVKVEGNGAASRLRRRRSISATRVETELFRQILTLVGDPPITVAFWDGQEVVSRPDSAERIRIRIGDRATLWKILFDPQFQFPEAYVDGRVEIEGSIERLMYLIGASTSETRSRFGERWFALLGRILHPPRRNTLAGSRDNIHRHYDLGNDFYRLWLDEQLLYTCAYFEESTASLEQAQCAKMDHVCRKLGLKPGETVIEAGCGWGAFALHMARHWGVRVRAYNISREQVGEARRRAQAEGLADRVEFILDDWRNISGSCDAFVSIGMLEHVGPANYRQLGDVIDRCLARDGRGLIHTIGRNRAQPLDYWTERRIFPGACPPSMREMTDLFERSEFSILDVENLRLHYAETLRHWLARFEQSTDVVARMYDERFVRTWRTYLAGSVAAFETGSLQLFQVLFARPQHNRLPMTRAGQYAHLFDSRPTGNGDGAPRHEPEYWGDR